MSVMRRPRLSTAHSIPRKVKVYDIKKKELIGEFESASAAAIFCGLGRTSHVSAYIKNKTRCHKNGLGISICFR